MFQLLSSDVWVCEYQYILALSLLFCISLAIVMLYRSGSYCCLSLIPLLSVCSIILWLRQLLLLVVNERACLTYHITSGYFHQGNIVVSFVASSHCMMTVSKVFHCSYRSNSTQQYCFLMKHFILVSFKTFPG